jgi:hypothetical protein
MLKLLLGCLVKTNSKNGFTQGWLCSEWVLASSVDGRWRYRCWLAFILLDSFIYTLKTRRGAKSRQINSSQTSHPSSSTQRQTKPSEFPSLKKLFKEWRRPVLERLATKHLCSHYRSLHYLQVFRWFFSWMIGGGTEMSGISCLRESTWSETLLPSFGVLLAQFGLLENWFCIWKLILRQGSNWKTFLALLI